MSPNEKLSLSTRTNPFGEKYIFEVARKVFNTLDSQTLFTSQYGGNFLQHDSFYVFAGTDCGLLVKFILKKELPENVKIVFVERPEILRWLSRHLKNVSLPQNICVVDLDNLSQQLQKYNINAYVLLDKLFFIPSLCIQHLHYRPYTGFATKIQDYIKTLHWNIRINLDKKEFIIGQLENIAENRFQSSILDNSFAGHTAILLAGGPSLDDILPWVNENRDGLVVFAVSRVARRLLDQDIVPDFFVSVHTQAISFEVSKELLHFHDKSILISHSQACPKLISQWQGKHVYMGHLFPWTSAYNNPSEDLVGPTVSHAAFDKIVKMGFTTIILGGVDLCFGESEKTHAKGSIEFEQTSQAEGGDVKVLTNSGRIAETTFAFHRGIIEFGKMAQNAHKRGCRIINPSLKSAVIVGVEVTDLADIRLSSPRKSLKEMTSALETQGAKTVDHHQIILQELEKAASTIEILRQLALDGFKTVKALGETTHDLPTATDVSQIEKIVKKLEDSRYNWIYQVIYSFGIHYFAALTSPLQTENVINSEYVLRKKLHFTAFIVSADRLKAIIIAALARVKARMAEKLADTDLGAITEQWQKDNQPGRALLFLKEHDLAISDLDQPWQQLFESFTNQYNQQFSAALPADGGLRSKVTWTKLRLDKLRGRLFAMFSGKDLEGLEKIIISLEESPSAQTTLTCYLAQGLKCELRNDFQSALSWYNKIIDENDGEGAILLEDSLSRIASISLALNDLANAQLALQCLADISPVHAPRLAEFFYISGQTNLALEVYADYLGKVPDDLETMLKLGRIYKELNSQEGMKMIIDHVLARDPHNPTALHLRQYLTSTFPS